MTDKIKVTSVPGGSITVSGLSEFSPAQIFDCGQCFRFDAAGMAGHGDKASLFWNQEAPNYLSVKYPLEPERIYKRMAPYIAEASEASVRASRIPAGHHEGFIEGFANIYKEFCAAVLDRKAHDFPGPREGVRTMKFVEAALASSAAGARWKAI